MPTAANRSPAAEFAYLARLSPKEALAYLQGKRTLTPTFSWQDLWQEEHAIQFTVSRMANLDILRAMQEGIEKSVNGDLSRRDWTRDMQTLLQKEGWWGKKEVTDPATGETLSTTFDSARLKLIFDTNTRMAYSAGHWQQAVAAKASHPYIRYITKQDERVRFAHQTWDSLTLSIDDDFWKTHFPPNGWRCRCRTTSVSHAEYGRLKEQGRIKTDPPAVQTHEFINRRTGEITQIPIGIDPGFDYNPGMARTQNLGTLVGDKLASAPAAIGAVFGQELDIERISEEFGEFFDASYKARGNTVGKSMVVGALKPLWVEKATAAGFAPVSAEIAIRDYDIAHTFRAAKEARALPLEWFRDLPQHLQQPQAVVLDTTHKTPALLLIFDVTKMGKKLAVQVNYKVKKQGIMNIVDTGQFVDVSGIRAMIGHGYDLLEGEL